ncbi:MAG: hypothetical protein FH758_15180 [Firmicutes bacterium]|nr:hypothetical protein [Bacillota bacterium]
MSLSTYEIIMQQKKEAKEQGKLPKMNEVVIYGVDFSDYSERDYMVVCREINRILDRLSKQIRKGKDILNPAEIDFKEYKLIKYTAKNKKDELIKLHKLEAKKVVELFRESVALKNILSDQDLEIMLSEIKKQFEESGIEFIKEYPFDEVVNEYIV